MRERPVVIDVRVTTEEIKRSCVGERKEEDVKLRRDPPPPSVSEDNRRALLKTVPLSAAAVEIRALLEDPRTQVAKDATGAVLNNDALDLAAIEGEPQSALIESLGRQVSEGRSVLALKPISTPAIAFRRAVVMTLENEERFALARQLAKGRVRKMVAADLLSVDDAQLRAELAHAFERLKAERRHIYVSTERTSTRRSDRAVAFAFACYRCWSVGERPGYFDIAVDTCEGFRQQGHALKACAAMIAAERSAKCLPVWGADAENIASVATARSLGFEESGEEIWVGTFAPPSDNSSM